MFKTISYFHFIPGHFNNMACVSFSPDGTTLATGGQDGKLKLWTILSGFCFVTFSDHTASVTAVKYSIGKNNVVFSASLDGTVRAYDTTRYRNFRTFTSPRPAQFSWYVVSMHFSVKSISRNFPNLYIYLYIHINKVFLFFQFGCRRIRRLGCSRGIGYL